MAKFEFLVLVVPVMTNVLATSPTLFLVAMVEVKFEVSHTAAYTLGHLFAAAIFTIFLNFRVERNIYGTAAGFWV